ncbi:oxysterol-binding protein 1-like [Panthera pardus]|uniref:Oxysterol-binding protein 1-like n=1 Tax=Panthera pardus TaxID=9691 RepID=A0A9W2V9A2_PANPR|nr:oxysterol-binding protein 1-like [Panthera pardus]
MGGGVVGGHGGAAPGASEATAAATAAAAGGVRSRREALGRGNGAPGRPEGGRGQDRWGPGRQGEVHVAWCQKWDLKVPAAGAL